MKDEYDFDYSKAWIPIDKCNPEAGDLVYITLLDKDNNRYVSEGRYDKNFDRWFLGITNSEDNVSKLLQSFENKPDKVIAWKRYETLKPHYYMGFFFALQK